MAHDPAAILRQVGKADERFQKLIAYVRGPEALAATADDAEAMAMLRAVIQPEFFDGVRAGTRSTDDAAALVTAVVVPWFAARLRDSARAEPRA